MSTYSVREFNTDGPLGWWSNCELGESVILEEKMLTVIMMSLYDCHIFLKGILVDMDRIGTVPSDFDLLFCRF